MYCLMRGHGQYITAPNGLGATGQVVPPVLAADTNPKKAWLAPDLDTALERRQLLQMAFGLTTEVRKMPEGT